MNAQPLNSGIRLLSFEPASARSMSTSMSCCCDATKDCIVAEAYMIAMFTRAHAQPNLTPRVDEPGASHLHLLASSDSERSKACHRRRDRGRRTQTTKHPAPAQTTSLVPISLLARRTHRPCILTMSGRGENGTLVPEMSMVVIVQVIPLSRLS